MTAQSPLWPSQLDHIRIDAADPAALAAFYRDILGMAAWQTTDGSFVLTGPQRRIVVGHGTPGAQPYGAFKLQSPRQLAELRAFLAAKGIALLPSPTPLFAPDALAVRDPDGRLAVFGLPRADMPAGDHSGFKPVAAALPARLQHVVVASTRLQEMMDFYLDGLGFVVSDYVRETGGNRANTVCFMRSDPEHHSLAVFRAPESRPDHHCYEATSWNDLRDWADHLSRHKIKIWWGPGRHGPGNNLFLMCKDPNGYLFEISAELEIMPYEMAPRVWDHGERALNLWGPGFMRS
jgi:catechol 2,3-dioxygenase-like lactoylglutathione lyase family enzyme